MLGNSKIHKGKAMGKLTRWFLKYLLTTQTRVAKSAEGFSVMEILIMILIVTGFLLGALQAIVMATMLKVQANDKIETLKWIEQDLEQIRYQAFILDRTGSPYTPHATACSSSTYGTRLRDQSLLAGTPAAFPATDTVTIEGHSYDIYRDYVPSANNLQINYTIVYDSTHSRYSSINPYTHPAPNNTNIVSTLSTEVIANAALDCS